MEVAPGATERSVVITGAEAGVLAAKEQVLRLVRERENERSTSRRPMGEFNITVS